MSALNRKNLMSKRTLLNYRGITLVTPILYILHKKYYLIFISGCATSDCPDINTAAKNVKHTDYNSIIQKRGIRPGKPKVSLLYKLIRNGRNPTHVSVSRTRVRRNCV